MKKGLFILVALFFVLNAKSDSQKPVSFGNVNIAYVGNVVEINWSTLSESNNNYFEIERSTDSVNYTVVGNLSGTGNASSTQYYLFTDVNVVEGTAYCYRIKQYDLDGSFSFSSQTCFIALGTNEVNMVSSQMIQSYPNPVSTNWNISWDPSVNFYSLQIFDITGKLILTKNLNQQNRLDIDLSELSAGQYIYRLIGEDSQFDGKLKKE